MSSYEICLADYEVLLPALGSLIKAKYEEDSFSKAEERFHGRSQATEEWELVGQLGKLAVRFEEHEGYYFSTFEASGDAFQEGKSLLWLAYLEQGGNPNAQEKP